MNVKVKFNFDAPVALDETGYKQVVVRAGEVVSLPEDHARSLCASKQPVDPGNPRGAQKPIAAEVGDDVEAIDLHARHAGKIEKLQAESRARAVARKKKQQQE